MISKNMSYDSCDVGTGLTIQGCRRINNGGGASKNTDCRYFPVKLPTAIQVLKIT